jgi:hypothetical protein
MVNSWIDHITIVEDPPDNTPPEVRSLCTQFGLHSYMGVLCGWQWAIEHKDQVVEYKYELQIGNTRQSFNTSKADVMNKVMKVYRR